MRCSDLREAADSFLCGELPAESQAILLHLERCATCRAAIEARSRLRGAIRTAFERSPGLQPHPAFEHRLRHTLRDAARNDGRSWRASRGWLALAATLLVAAAVTGGLLLYVRMPVVDMLALDAIGDHRNCALQFRLVRTPVPLEEGARRFDSAYRLLASSPPDDTVTPAGNIQVIERHSCAYGGRRFGHVVMEYRGRLVSLLLTADEEHGGPAPSAAARPRPIGQSLGGLSVVSLGASRHTILMVGDLGAEDLTQLSTVVSVPLAERLAEASGAGPHSRGDVHSPLPPLPREVRYAHEGADDQIQQDRAREALVWKVRRRDR